MNRATVTAYGLDVCNVVSGDNLESGHREPLCCQRQDEKCQRVWADVSEYMQLRQDHIRCLHRSEPKFLPLLEYSITSCRILYERCCSMRRWGQTQPAKEVSYVP